MSDSKEIVERVVKHELLIGIVGAELVNHHIRYIPIHHGKRSLPLSYQSFLDHVRLEARNC